MDLSAKFTQKQLDEVNELQRKFKREMLDLDAKHAKQTQSQGFSVGLARTQLKERSTLEETQRNQMKFLGKKQQKDYLQFEKELKVHKVAVKAEAEHIQQEAMNARRAERINMEETARQEAEDRKTAIDKLKEKFANWNVGKKKEHGK